MRKATMELWIFVANDILRLDLLGVNVWGWREE
jgi:hypothetical protein